MDILQMALLEPTFAILDETDSGLDIDALRIVAEGVNALRSPNAASSSSPIISGCSTISFLTPCMSWRGGRIVSSGGKDLAVELEKSGYKDYVDEPALG